jgi:hypothetical protein
MTETFGGMTPAEWLGFIANAIDTAGGQAATRPPDARHNLTRKLTGTVVSVSDNSVDVQLDCDAPGTLVHCSPGAAALPQQRGIVVWDAAGAAVWIGGSTIDAGGGGGPILIPQLSNYTPVTPETLGRIVNGNLQGAWTQLPGTPLVYFSIELLWGSGTTVPVFVMPVIPVARRHVFSAFLMRQPGTIPYPAFAFSGTDGSNTFINVYTKDGGDTVLTDANPPSLAAGPSRLAITGLYEAQQ